MTEAELLLLAQARRRRREREAAAQKTLTVNEDATAAETMPNGAPVPQTKEEWAAYMSELPDARQGKSLLALGDAALSTTSGSVGSIVGGVLGAGDMVVRGDMGKAANTYDLVSGAIQTSPFSEGGAELLEKVGVPLEKVQTFVRDRLDGDKYSLGLPPGAAAAVETGLFGLPELLTGGKLGATVIKRPRITSKSQALQDMEAAAKRLGIDLDNARIQESVRDSAAVMAGGNPGSPGSRSASGAEDLHGKVAGAATASRSNVDALYTMARSKDASIDVSPIQQLVKDVEVELTNAGADLTAGPAGNRVLARRLAELESIDKKVIGARKGQDARKVPGQSSTILGPDGKPLVADADTPVQIPLNELEIMNQRLTTDISNAYGSGRPGHARELRKLRTRINDMLDKQFADDMISGDKSAKDAWTNARLANRRHKERFSDDRVIKDLVENQRPAKDTIKLILGASEVGHRAEAVLAVRRLKEILGPNAEELQSLRNAFYADLYEPLFKDNVSYTTALERIRRIKRDDGALIRELGVSERDIDFMERAVKVAKGVTTKADLDKKEFGSRIISRLGFGHEIAQAGVRVKLVNMVLDRALGVGQKTHEQLLREFAGLQSSGPLIDFRDPRVQLLNAHAAVQSEMENSDEDPRDR